MPGAPQPLAEPAVQERLNPGPAGAPDVRVFVMAAEKGASRPAILYINGGGFILGAARTDVAVLQAMALKHDCVIVSVDYRLAPETPFPGPVEDAYAALQWIASNAGELGVDPSRIAVMGESAGGGLAAMLALMARDRAEVPIDQQILVYPMLDDRTGSTVAMPYWMGAYSWTAEANRFGWTALLGVQAGSATVPPGSVPAREQNLAGLPPAYIAVGSVDLFVNEDIDFAQRLINAGVPTELLVIPGGYHGFQRSNPETILAQRFDDAIDAAITRAFNPPQPSPQEEGYSLDTPIARLLLNPQAMDVLLKYMPDVVNGPAAHLVGGMSLKKLAAMAPGNVSEEKLRLIDEDLAALPGAR